MHQNILFLEFGYFGLWRTHLQNYKFWRPLLRAETLTSQSFLFIFNVNYEQKWHLKVCADARAICPTGFLFSLSAYAVWYLDTKTFFEYKTIAKKKCAPKTRATLAMPNILFGVVVVVCRVSLNVDIFVPRLILNLNMFYKTVKCIRIRYLKSRKIFASWVFVPLKMGNMVFCLFLRP